MEKEILSYLGSFILSNVKSKWNELKNSMRNKKFLALVIVSSSSLIAALSFIAYSIKQREKKKSIQNFKANEDDKDNTGYFDVCIVGASMSGITCAFYLAKAGKSVLLIDKKYFKLKEQKNYVEDEEYNEEDLLEKGIQTLGDSGIEIGVGIPAKGQTHLKTMGVLQQILSEGKGRWANNGGFISPCGNSFIGCGVQRETGRIAFVGRKDLKQKMAISCIKEGTHFLQCCEMNSFNFIEKRGVWEIKYFDKLKEVNHTIHSYILIAADGAKSEIARDLKLQKSPPNSVGFFAKVDKKYHNFLPDCVSYFPSQLLSNHGFIGIYKNFDDSVTIACFGYIDDSFNGVVTSEAEEINFQTSPKYKQLWNNFCACLANDNNLKEVLGENGYNNIEKIEKLNLLRTHKGKMQKQYSDNFLVIGHAAGHVDPLTGMGAQYGIQAAKIAADVILEAYVLMDLSSTQMKKYQDKCNQSFGREFLISHFIRLLSSKFPITVDAVASLVQDRGEEYLVQWAYIMTGVHSKFSCLHPRYLLLYVGQLLKEIYRQKINPMLFPPPINKKNEQHIN